MNKRPFTWPSGCAPSAQNPPGGPAPIFRVCVRCAPLSVRDAIVRSALCMLITLVVSVP